MSKSPESKKCIFLQYNLMIFVFWELIFWWFFDAKTIKNPFKNCILDGMAKIRCQNVPRRLQDGSKRLPGRTRTPQDGICFFGGPTWSHVGHPFRPKTAPEPSRTPPKGLVGDVCGRLGNVLEPLAGQEPTRASLGAVLAWFWGVFGGFLGGFWLIFGRCSLIFWWIFNWLFDHFSVDFWLIASRIRSTVYSTVYGNVYSTAYSGVLHKPSFVTSHQDMCYWYWKARWFLRIRFSPRSWRDSVSRHTP